MIVCEQWSYRYPGAKEAAFPALTGTLGLPGEVSLICGATGSGKSTVLKGFGGILRPLFGGFESGSLRADRESIALVPQCSEDRHLCDTPREEASVSGHFAGLDRRETFARWDRIVEELSLQGLERRPFRVLSGGQRKKMAVALGLVRDPRILLLDEPLTQLDPNERMTMVSWLDGVRRIRNLALVVTEHREEPWLPLVTTRWRLSQEFAASKPNALPTTHIGKPVFSFQGIRYAYPSETEPVFSDLSLELCGHEIVALVGANGSGKSTLLRWIAGLLEGAPRPAFEVGYLPQNPVDFFLSSSLSDEFAMAKVSRAWIDAFGLEPCLARHPSDLSVGQQQKAALAILLAKDPGAALLLDEPTHGLDARERANLAALLRDRAARGGAVIVASHDADFLDSIATRWVRR